MSHEEENFYIEKVLLHAVFNARFVEEGKLRLYLVKWDSYSIRDCTWEPEEHIPKDKILEYRGQEVSKYAEGIILDSEDQRPEVPKFEIKAIRGTDDRINSRKGNTLENMYLVEYEGVGVVGYEPEDDLDPEIVDEYKRKNTGKKRKRKKETNIVVEEEPAQKKVKVSEEENKTQRSNSRRKRRRRKKKKKASVEMIDLEDEESSNISSSLDINAIVINDDNVFLEPKNKPSNRISYKELLETNPKVLAEVLVDGYYALLEEKDWENIEIEFNDAI